MRFANMPVAVPLLMRIKHDFGNIATSRFAVPPSEAMPPGWREIPDPEAEVRRLVGERASLETVPLPRRDLDVLLAVATLYLTAFTDDELMTLPEKLRLQDVEDVVHRHGRRY